MEFRKAQTGDLPSVKNLYTEVINELDRTINYPKWVNGLYPSEPLFIGAIEKGWLFLLTDGEDVIGSVILNCFPTGEYPAITWQRELAPEQVVNIHTFAIHPHFSGKGVGSKMIGAIKEHAKQNGYQSIRLEVFRDNAPARRLYEKNDFVFVDTVDIGETIYRQLGIKDINIFDLYEFVL